jgi:hypothetical protein
LSLRLKLTRSDEKTKKKKKNKKNKSKPKNTLSKPIYSLVYPSPHATALKEAREP